MSHVDVARTMLRNVVDPEIGLNIVDLGLIYELTVEDNKARILMTFTTMGCPVSGALVDGVYEALEPMGLDDIRVDLTFDPPWTPALVSAEGQKRLGIRR